MKKNIKEIGKLTIVLAVLALFVSAASAQPVATDLGVNNTSGDQNTFVLVPVNITNVQNESIAGIVFDISFDPSVINLTRDRVLKGDLTTAWDSPSLNIANGIISIVFNGSGTEIPINGSGSVVVLNFSVVGAPGAKSTMNISGIQLSGQGGALGTALAKNGTFIINSSEVVTSITISPSTITLTAGATQTFTAKAMDQKDAPIAGINITFTSNNTTVGTVAPENMLTGVNGIATITFTALANGTSTVTAANGSVTGNATVTVSAVVEQNLTTIAISPPSISLTAGETQTFTASPKDQDGAAFLATVTWTSSNTTVGTVNDSGNFTALAPGTSMVNSTNGSVIGTAIVTVSIEDIIAPVTTISGVAENGSYNNNVNVTLNATDNLGGSGVKETFYIINGGPTTTYSAPFVVDTVGPDNVTYWSTDIAGNVEPQNMVNFTIASINDTIPPMTTSDVNENGSYNNSVTVTLNATDNPGGSGINEILYMVNGGPTTTYSEPFVVDTVGPDNVTYWSTDIAGNVELQNMVNFTIVNIPQVNATATREIERKFILPGESTIITVRISGNANALALHEIPPEGWNVTRGTDSAYAFKNSTNEWVWKSMEANETVTYTLTAPENISIGTYQIEGTITDANGILVNVEGDNIVKIDILEFYRRLGNDPGVVETIDLLRAFDDFRNNIVPQGFDRPLSAEEVDELVNEWTNS
jgi:uncharacterized protein YjdB